MQHLPELAALKYRMSLSISHSACQVQQQQHKTKIYPTIYILYIYYTYIYIVPEPVQVEPFASQNIWYNNKSAACKRHKKPSTVPPAQFYFQRCPVAIF